MMGLDYRKLRLLFLYAVLVEAVLLYHLVALHLDWPVLPLVVPVALAAALGFFFGTYFLQVMRKTNEDAQQT